MFISITIITIIFVACIAMSLAIYQGIKKHSEKELEELNQKNIYS